MKIITSLSILSLACSVAAAPARSQCKADHGAVASESAVCSNIGIDILKAGGNAADAMVATVLCVGVIGCYHSGIGGGGFMLVRDAKGKYEFIDFRETAPAAAFQDMYINNTDASIYGGLASGVPGELAGLHYLHDKYGKLPWSSLVMPAVQQARNGFVVTADMVKYMDATAPAGGKEDFFVQNPTWALDFARNATHRVQLGDKMTRKRYADTLETIADKGASAFYNGTIAEATIQALQRANGTMTLQDLADYEVAIRQPSSISYRGFKAHGGSAPSGGTVALAIMKILEGYDMSRLGQVNVTTHHLDEAMRFGYGARTELGDPSFVNGLDAYQQSMLSEAYAAEVRKRISDLHTLNVSAYDPKGLESLETPGTSHIATADKSGMAISLTTTINLLFGSQLMVPETGVIMNNEMNDFSIPGSSNAFGYIPSPANYIIPGKRPLSSISPVIVEKNGELHFVVGAAGGSRIITSTVQNLVHVLDQKMDSATAIAQPRLHDQLIPNRVSFEWGYDNNTVAYMASLGHNVTWVAPGQSTAQMIKRLSNGTFDAAGEPRQKASGGFAF